VDQIAGGGYTQGYLLVHLYVLCHIAEREVVQSKNMNPNQTSNTVSVSML